MDVLKSRAQEAAALEGLVRAFLWLFLLLCFFFGLFEPLLLFLFGALFWALPACEFPTDRLID